MRVYSFTTNTLLRKTKQENMNSKLTSPKGQENTLKINKTFSNSVFKHTSFEFCSVSWKLAQPCMVLRSARPWNNFRMVLWKMHFLLYAFTAVFFLLCILKLYYLFINFQQICLYICKPFSVHTVSPHCPIEHFITMTQKFKTI